LFDFDVFLCDLEVHFFHWLCWCLFRWYRFLSFCVFLTIETNFISQASKLTLCKTLFSSRTLSRSACSSPVLLRLETRLLMKVMIDYSPLSWVPKPPPGSPFSHRLPNFARTRRFLLMLYQGFISDNRSSFSSVGRHSVPRSSFRYGSTYSVCLPCVSVFLSSTKYAWLTPSFPPLPAPAFLISFLLCPEVPGSGHFVVRFFLFFSLAFLEDAASLFHSC